MFSPLNTRERHTADVRWMMAAHASGVPPKLMQAENISKVNLATVSWRSAKVSRTRCDSTMILFFFSDPSKQETHNGCVPATNDGMEGKGWCATTTTSDGIFDQWGYCEDPKCSDGPAAAPASNATLGSNPLVICGSCIAFGIVPSAVKCATNGTDVGETFLKAFDVSCIFKKCICNLLISTKARTFINILSMIGICARPTSWD